MLKRPLSGAPGVVPPVRAVDEEFSNRFPTVWEYMSQDAWEDGKKRDTSTLFLFVDSGQWTVMLKDRERDLVAFFKADRLSVALTVCEEALCDDRVDWRADRKTARKPSK